MWLLIQDIAMRYLSLRMLYPQGTRDVVHFTRTSDMAQYAPV